MSQVLSERAQLCMAYQMAGIAQQLDPRVIQELLARSHPPLKGATIGQDRRILRASLKFVIKCRKSCLARGVPIASGV